MTYTNEQLAVMTQDQLMGIVLQNQAGSDAQAVADPTVDTTAVATEIVQDSTAETVAETGVAVEVAQTDTEKAIDQAIMAISKLEDAGVELFEAEILAWKEKLANLEAKAIEEAETFVAEVQDEVATVETELVSFYEKYRTDINVIAVLIILHVAGIFGL